MNRRLILAGIAIVASASCLLAGRPGVVSTTTGETYEGDVTESPDEVVIRRHGVDTALTRERVTSIDYTSYAKRFDQAMTALAADDVAGRVELARDAFDRQEYELALRATESAIDINPMDRDARELESTISMQIQLEQRGPSNRATQPAAAAEDDDSPTRATSRRSRGLDDDQANRIRQLELSAQDNVRFQFRGNVRKRFVDSQPGMSYRAFSTRSDMDQALTIINKASPEMVEDVRIRGDPAGVQTFNRRIQTALVQGCATSACHGGAHAGAFRLMNGPTNPTSIITNFYLVTQYAQALDPEDQGIFSPSKIPMVDRGSARNSLLYQYALPRARAKFKHPAVRGWDGLFRSDDDPLARYFVQWMNVDLARVQPDYGITFALAPSTPATEPTSMPATGPATEPAPLPADASSP